MSWTYYNPSTGRVWSGSNALLNFATEASVGLETVGQQELKWILQARNASPKTVVIPHDRASNAARLALRRLVERELFRAPNALLIPAGFTVHGQPGRGGWLYFYDLTERGTSCWLRTKSEEA